VDASLAASMWSILCTRPHVQHKSKSNCVVCTSSLNEPSLLQSGHIGYASLLVCDIAGMRMRGYDLTVRVPASHTYNRHMLLVWGSGILCLFVYTVQYTLYLTVYHGSVSHTPPYHLQITPVTHA